MAAEPPRKSEGKPGKVRDWYVLQEKPVGGFVRLTVHQMLLVAWARMTSLISPFEFQVWWAAVEMRERRETASRDRKAGPAVPSDFGNFIEWAGLIGRAAGEKKTRAAFKRLHRLGLLTCSRSSVRLIESPDELRCENLCGYFDLVKLVGLAGKRAQPVPVPRTAVRLLAGGVSKAVSLTMLGVMLRSLRRRKLNGSWMCVSGGLVSTAWISEAFDLGRATVKHAVAHLVSIGWLSRQETPQWVQQRHGARTLINLEWKRPLEEPAAATISTPRTAENAAVSTPPIPVTKNSLRDKKTRNPPSRGPTGFSTGKDGKKKEPTLKDVSLDDLRDTGRLLVLFTQAVAAGLVGESDGERLNFVAAGEHAIVKGTQNPAGLFMFLVRNRQWNYCTNDDEDAANERLKRHFYGATRKRERDDDDDFCPPKRVEIPISDDAKLVAAVQQVVVQRRIAGEPFHLLKRERPEWTRERWESGLLELENARMQRLGLTSCTG